MSFFEEWFGAHAGREIFYAEQKTREFIEKSGELIQYVQDRNKNGQPAYASVQPYQARDQPFGLEKLFFDFDCEENTEKAWKEAASFSEALIQYYKVLPFVTFSGNKGYHVYVFLSSTVPFSPSRLGIIKEVYGLVQEKILKGFKFETLDPAVLGDIKRLARVPFSVHEKTGKVCCPVSLSHQFITPRSLEIYRDFGLNPSVLKTVSDELETEKNWRKASPRKKTPFKLKDSENIRPCIKNAVSLHMERGEGHLMRLAVAIEHLCMGASTDQIVELFRGQSDFNESKTRYFVEDALRKRYKPFKCRTIRSLGFCLGNSCPVYNRSFDLLNYAEKPRGRPPSRSVSLPR
jgi:hypothetical protein